MSFNFTRTRAQLASMVLRKLNVEGTTGASLSAASSDYDIIYEAFDLWIKQAHKAGLFWRKVSTRSTNTTMTANVASISAASAADILYPVKMTVTNLSIDEPLQIIYRTDYAGIQDKNYSGVPTKAYWAGSSEFLLWPVPSNTPTVKLIYERIATDTTAGAAIDVDTSMLYHVKDIIAYYVGDDFEIDEPKMVRWKAASDIAEKNIRKLNADRVDFKTIAVDQWDDRDPMSRMKTDY